MKYIINLEQVSSSDIEIVGGKNASLGEMLQFLSPKGVKIPGGFATTIEAYRKFLSQNGLDKKIEQALNGLKVTDIKALNKTSAQIRRWIVTTPFLPEFENEISAAYKELNTTAVAVRSSATAEDLPTTSFAGQQDTFLNVSGIKNVLLAIKQVFASVFTSRAITYRHHHQFEHNKVGLSVGVQPMVRSDKATSGVIFTLDTESGFDQVILITASYGLGEPIVQGSVNPDEFFVSKPLLQKNKFSILKKQLGEKAMMMTYASAKSLGQVTKTIAVPRDKKLSYCINDNDIETLARQALIIEKHYGKPMDIEWAKDGLTGELFIVQARPETVKSKAIHEQAIERYVVTKKGKVLAQGLSIGQRVGQGKARIILDHKKMHEFIPGEILVTDMTDPDWEPVMKHAAAIVTNRGGRTCHAAIIARELGIPAVVGCTNATTKISNNQHVSVSCADGQIGYIYEGRVPFKVDKTFVKDMPKLPLKLCLNVSNPNKVFSIQFLPNEGVGLARIEFIISNMIGIHPNALLNVDKLPKKTKQSIIEKTFAYASPVEFYIEKLREGIATIAAAFYPKQVIFRFSDFKSNEYANLLGGNLFEPREENPMLGFRGASRYYSEQFREAFKLECEAFKRVREKMGLINAQLMVPFVRTVKELSEVITLIEKNGLKRNKNDLKIYMMCEIPANALLAAEFLKLVDGFSIGSNDLTQLTLGLDRDSNLVSSLFDERNEAIKKLLHNAISECNKQNKYIGICGQGPSDYPDFAEWLMQEGIQNVSLNPDTVIETWLSLSKKLNKQFENKIVAEPLTEISLT